MGDKIPDGGPAYPHMWQPEIRHPESGDVVQHAGPVEAGMSLRDAFAIAAIRAEWGNGEAMTAEDAARMAYQLADAMLAERERS